MDINLIVIIGFVIAILIIGIYYGKGVNTFQDYAVGNRSISTWAITISLMATIYGSRFLYAVLSGYYRRGLYAMTRDLKEHSLLSLLVSFKQALYGKKIAIESVDCIQIDALWHDVKKRDSALTRIR